MQIKPVQLKINQQTVVLELTKFGTTWLFMELYDTELYTMAKFYSKQKGCFLNVKQTDLLKFEQQQILKVKFTDEI